MALLLPKPPSKKETTTRGGADKDDKQKEAVIDTFLAVESIDKTLFGFTGFFNKKQNKKFQQKQEMYQRKSLKIQEQQNDGGKDKKTTKKWRKVVDFLYGGVKGLFKAVGAIVKSLSLTKVTGLLGLLLGIFLMLRLGLLDIILPAALDLFITLIEGIIKFLPKILKFMWKVVSEYVPQIITAISDAISDALGIESETGRKIVKFFTTIGVALFGFNKILGLFGTNIISVLSKVIPFLIANPIVALVLAIIAAIALIWVFAEEISSFFDNLWERFKKAGTLVKVIIVALAVVFATLFPPIAAVIAIIIVLAKLFASFKKIGVAATFKLIWKTIKDFFLKIWNAIKNFFIKIFTFIKGIKSKIVDVFNSVREKISSFFSNLWERFKKAGKPIKILVGIIVVSLALLFAPLTLFIGSIIILTKLFKSFKKIGVVNTFKLIWKTIKEFLLKLWKKIRESFGKSVIGNFIKKLIKVMISPFIAVGKTISSFFKKIVKVIKNILDGVFKVIQKIKKISFSKILQNIWTGISSFFKEMMGGIIEKFKPIKEFFTSIGKKIGDFFEPAIRKIKLLVSTIGDIFGSIIDWILYTVAPIVPGVDRGAAKSAEEYRLVSYASKQASDTDSRGRIEQYANAVMRKDEAKMKELAEQMTAPQQALATSMAGAKMSNLENYSNRLKQGGDFLTSRTKIFGTPVNNSASL